MPYIELLGRGDRLGANITNFISQIIYAHFHKCEIRYDKEFILSGDDVKFVPFNQKYLDSVFIKTLFDYIDIHNSTIIKDDVCVKMFSIHYFEIISKVVLDIKMDLISYFKKYMFNDINRLFKENCNKLNYKLPFDRENTIIVHLRLDDVSNRMDYDGRLCASEFRKVLDNDMIADNNTDNLVRNKYGHNINFQSPIPFERVDNVIKSIINKNPNYNVYIVTNPGENTSHIPYPVLSSNDESYDLYLLSNCKHLVMSRSTYSLSAMFFNEHDNVYIPLWGHVPCFGLYTKFDLNNNITFFY